MRPSDKRYVRLPGSRRGMISGASLWLGSDHLLSVRRTAFSEEYRRYYFNEIQAISVQYDPSKKGLTVDLIVTGLAVALIATLAIKHLVAFIPLTTIATIIYLWVRLRRPNCKTYIQTAANTDLVPALSRIRSTPKVFARIEPLIRESQANFPVEMEQNAQSLVIVGATELPPPLPDPAAELPPALPPPVPQVLPPPLPIAPLVRQPVGLYLAGFAVTAGVGVAKVTSAYMRVPAFTYLLPAGYVLSVIIFLIPLFKGFLSHLRWRQLAPLLTAMIFAGLTGVYSLSFAVQRAGSTKTEPKIEQFYRWFDSVRAFVVLPGALLVIFGIWGLWAFVFAPSEESNVDSLALSPADRG